MKNLKKLSRNDLKKVAGGYQSLEDANACASCKKICHSNDNGSYGWGMCSSSTGGTSCHNYCCETSSTYWC